MNQINPFTNAPTNPPEPPPAAHVPPPPAQQAKPPAAQTSAPKKKPSEFDLKHIVKTLVMVVIGIVVAKLAFDSVVPMFKPQAAPGAKGPKTTAVQKSGVPRLPTASRSGKKGKEELSLSETFAAAKRTPRPAPVQAEPFVVNGVFLSEGGGSASAIVNNKVVQVGDTVDGAVVKAITEEGVELMRVDEIIKLRYR